MLLHRLFTGQRVAQQLVEALRPWPWGLPILALLGIATSLSEGLGIGMLIPFLHVATGQAEFGQGVIGRIAAAIPPDRQLPLLGAAIVALVALRTLMLYLNVVLSNWLNGHVSRSLRQRMFRIVLERGHIFIKHHQSGDLLNVMDSQVWRYSDALSALFTYVVSVSTMLVFGLLLMLLSWQLTLGIAAAVGGTALVTRAINRRVSRLSEQALTTNSAVLDRLIELLGNARTISAFGNERRERARFDAATESLRLAFLRMEKANGIGPALVEFLYTPLLIGAVVAAVATGVALPVIFAFLLLVYRLQPHVRNFEASRVQLATADAAVTAISDLLAQEPVSDQRGGAPFHRLEQGIVFDNLSFRFMAGEPVLDALSFTIRPGQVTAIVGPSGAGKSTIFNLLLGLIQPTGGGIRIDGLDLRDLDLDDWRAALALAGQDADLFAGTIGDNIAYGAPGCTADEAALWDAARQASADGFIRLLPQGMDTLVGPQGSKLSGGQRQRIGLARALIRKPNILLLDEATNALDGLSETIVNDALAALSGNTTIIIIAHRLSTIERADQILVLDHGGVGEAAPPHLLRAAGGAFARLHGRERQVAQQ